MQNIVGRLWLKVEYKIKQDQLYMGNYHQVLFGFTINYHAANMRPRCCQHVTMHCLFAFCPTNISKILAFDVDTFRCGKESQLLPVLKRERERKQEQEKESDRKRARERE